MNIFPLLMKAMLAVVPAVLGKPLAVFGHFSEKKKSFAEYSIKYVELT